MKIRFLSVVLSMMFIAGCVNEEKLTFEPYVIEGLEQAPGFWQVRPSQIIELCENVKVGKSEVIAKTPGGFPVYAYFYGEFNESAPQTNWSAGNSSNALTAYMGEGEHKETIMLLAGVHGGEPEAVAAAMNMIKLLETGTDFRGQSDTTFVNLCSNYRVIIVPCANMDGRSVCPDHLREQPFEVFRAVCQGTWKDGSLVGWKESKRHFPLPIDKVSFPGGYPNFDGYNIQHDVTPGDVRTEEAKAILKLIARWRVDFMLNAHSCESAPYMMPCSLIDTPRHQVRGRAIAQKVNTALYEMGLFSKERYDVTIARPSAETLNLSSMVNQCSGGLGLTLECSSSYANIHTKERLYTFDEMMEPVFVAMKIVMQDGMQKPLAERITAGR